jgi:HK97 gp10 family phage protein
MPRQVRITVDQAAIDALAKNPGVLAGVEEVAEAAADLMRKRAPKDSGEGAASIHVEPDDDEPGFRIGWDPDHFYMLFPEFGTEQQPARPFMRPTADEFNRR